MQDQDNIEPLAPKRIPWNKGKLTGAKPPLRPKHVWAIRTKLQVEGRKRDLALFNLAVDSKLRGCDVVSIRVEDIAPRLRNRPRIGAAEENRSPGQIRTDGDPPSPR